MGLVRVIVESGRYAAIGMAMEKRGYVRHILGGDAAADLLVRLPPGTYWRAEPTDAGEMLDDAIAAALEAGEVGVRIIATAGGTRWHGLPSVDEG